MQPWFILLLITIPSGQIQGKNKKKEEQNFVFMFSKNDFFFSVILKISSTGTTFKRF